MAIRCPRWCRRGRTIRWALYAMRLALPGGSYLIHGTNNPIAVGMAVTHGCIRMYPEDIAELFPHGGRGYAGLSRSMSR